MKQDDPIVITGMGLVTPIGSDESTFWQALTAGRTGAAAVTSFDTSELPRTIACQVKDAIEDPDRLGRASALAVRAARDALTSSGLEPAEPRLRQAVVAMGTTMGETEFIEERLEVDASRWLDEEQAGWIHRGRPGSIARNVLEAVGSEASGMDVYGACAAGNMAMASARRALMSGECDVALAGGADGFSRLAFIGFMRSRVMSEGVCKPFDQARDGLLVGEGACVFVLERRSSAAKRQAPIRAVVTGIGLSCESYHPTRPDPEGDGLSRSTAAALRDAEIDPQNIDYICAHGTGTPHNDAIESKVMARMFPSSTPFSSIKALTGHPMGAASSIETAACILALEHQALIPTWHLDTPLDPCPLDAVRSEPRDASLSIVLNNSAGFGGYNASLVLSKN